MKIILEETFDHAEWTIKPSQRVNFVSAGMDRLAVRRWLKAHGRRMPLVVLTQRGKPAVVSDVSEADASGVIENQESLQKLEKQIEYVCEFWTDWRSRAR
jgi:DNA-binding NarL/FixJ family response regulator